jgi:hypothetical protein
VNKRKDRKEKEKGLKRKQKVNYVAYQVISSNNTPKKTMSPSLASIPC